jgi:orotate phosphoribosyltransferase
MSLTVLTVADLHRSLAANLWRLPRDIDGVVAASPAGALAAGIVASHLDRPLLDGDATRAGSVLLVEASAVDMVAAEPVAGGPTTAHGKTIRVAVFADVRGGADFDLVLERVPAGTVFEWSLFHGDAMARACLDIDGVLCRDPTDDENDDGDAYRHFLATAAPLVTPSVPVHALVTSRLERYRDLTERWLDVHGITYDRLIMMDHPDAAARSRAARQAVYKAAAYRASGAELFVESDPRLAVQIAQLARRRVIAFPDGMVVEPSLGGLVRVRLDLARRRAKRVAKTPRRWLGRAYRRLRAT